ncbi:MAG: hypothetical protein LBP40_08485 [Campylobacteraceae bacterium]|jgi:drug/metabolite transporter (DMT)-like permease|nr:hypothetical protein [Campylobacteraceae bacterium]
MNETIELVNAVLSFSVIALAIVALGGLVSFSFAHERDVLRKRFRAVIPIYYMFLAIMLLCVLLLLSFEHFQFDNIYIIFIVWIYFLITSIMAYRLGKRQSDKFKNFTMKKYLGDIIICTLIYYVRSGF